MSVLREQKLTPKLYRSELVETKHRETYIFYTTVLQTPLLAIKSYNFPRTLLFEELSAQIAALNRYYIHIAVSLESVQLVHYLFCTAVYIAASNL